jgi:glycosyltransferase involved in cell wall biosynthesis
MTIQSVLSQKYEHLEYIVIDGGSTDGTKEVLEKYRPMLSYVLSEPDNGPFDAMNKGIRLATGDIIGIINADDWYAEHSFQQVATLYARDPSMEVMCGYIRYWEGNTSGKLGFAHPKRLRKEMSVNHPSVFVSSETYKRLGVFDLQYRLASDYELMLRFYLNGCKFAVIEEVIANMRLDGLSDRHWKKSLKELYEIKKRYLHFIPSTLEYGEIFLKEYTVRKLKKAGWYSLYKSYKNGLGMLSGKGKRF